MAAWHTLARMYGIDIRAIILAILAVFGVDAISTLRCRHCSGIRAISRAR
jgi:hypothetical protein